MLFDQFGREIQNRDIKRPETREIAVQLIRDRWSTYPSSGLTPTKLADILKLADAGDVYRQAELFEEMEEKDAHLASQFATRKLAVQGLSWEILPASEDAADKKIAEAATQAVSALPDFDDNVLDLLDAIAKGYSVMEILWDTSSGQAAVRGLKWVHARKVTFWDSFTPRILTEEEPARGVDPPPFKFIYYRYKARSGYDTRAGIMRVCAWMYLFKNYAIKDWVAFAEIFGMPIRIGKYEPGASAADKAALLSAIRSIGSDAAGIISKSTEIEFIESQKGAGTGQNIFEVLTSFCDAQMSKAILGQTLTSEAGGSKGQGSYALGQVHNSVRQDLVEADCRALGKTITQQLIRPLVGFNFGWDAAVPIFRFLYEPPEDLKTAADMYKVLTDMGFPISREHMSARFKVPLPAPDETPLEKPASPGPALPPTAAKLVAKNPTAKDVKAIVGQATVETSAQKALPGISDSMQTMLAPVLEMVDAADSLEEIGAKIYGLYPKLDSTRFQTLLARAMFAAALTGARSEDR